MILIWGEDADEDIDAVSYTHLVCSILEATTAQLVSIWFVAGGIIALISSLFHLNPWIQIAVFLVVSILMLCLTRPFVRRFLNTKKVRTNADRYVGMEGVVTTAIDNEAGVGMVRVAGNLWSARSEDNVRISEGTQVLIRRIEGVKVIVTPVRVPEHV